MPPDSRNPVVTVTGVLEPESEYVQTARNKVSVVTHWEATDVSCTALLLTLLARH